jgi:hypothetical protein
MGLREIIAQNSAQPCFETKNPTLDNFGRVLQRKIWIYFMDIWLFYGHLIYLIAIWYILRPFGICILWPFGICILWPFGIFYAQSVYFMTIW